jgi:hypothetical protein
MFPFIHKPAARHMRPIIAARRILILSPAVLILLMLLFAPLRVVAVEYDVTFNATWSATTHPGAYPAGAHFSPLIGVTHNDQVTFWESGGIATAGIEQMAETGGISTLQTEFAAAAGDADTIIVASGLGSPGSTSKTFEIVSTHSLVTLVTMIAPSPDWFVGVTDFDLRNGDTWVPQVTVDLFAYDSGTDSGVDFTSSNADITPHIPITLLGEPLAGLPALGTFTFTLLLPGDGNFDGKVDGLDYVIWASAYGDDPAVDPPGSPENGDYNDDGLVDGLDYVIWAINYAPGAAVVVPEPASLSLLVLGCMAAASGRRGRRSVITRRNEYPAPGAVGQSN